MKKMDTIESTRWIKDNGLFEQSKAVSAELKKIFTRCLSVKDENIVVLGDRGESGKNIAAIISAAYHLAGESLNLNSKLLLQEKKSPTDAAEEHIKESLSDLLVITY